MMTKEVLLQSQDRFVVKIVKMLCVSIWNWLVLVIYEASGKRF